MKKGTKDEREQEHVLNTDEPFNSETTRTVRSSGGECGVKELGRNELDESI
jgi:hypothetical protein